MTHKLIFSGLLLAMLSFVIIKSIWANPYAHKINQYMQAQTDLGWFSGAILVAKDGKIILSKGYGMANYELDVPNTTSAKFKLASISKQFTAMGIMQLQERGLLSVNDPLSKFIPDFPHGNEITLHHLLTHSSGIFSYTSLPDWNTLKIQPTNPAAIIELVKTKPLEFTPGKKFSYSNSGYVILTYIIEKVSGKTYEEFMQENIFKPLGMNESGYAHNSTILKKRASGYSKDNGILKNAAYLDMSGPSGAGGLYSTVEDMYKWDRALYTEKLIHKKSLDAMMQSHMPCTTEGECKEHYGYGFIINRDCDLLCITHEGGIDGFSTNIIRYVDNNIAIIILSNFDFSSIGTISKALTDIMFDKPYRMPKKHIEITLDPSLLDNYVGSYKDEVGPEIIIFKQNNKLYITNKGYEEKVKFLLRPESETDFFHTEMDSTVSFIKNDAGIITDLILHQEKDIQAKKL
jgi:CubicO group peptidase (beta-lactamase class C family)